MTDDKLIRDLEEAREGDRYLDVRIMAYAEGRDVRIDQNNAVLAKSQKPPHDECLLGFVDPGKTHLNFQPSRADFPRHSTSLDAKLPWENIVAVMTDGTVWKATHFDEEQQEYFEAVAHTEPLARRSAALRAREERNA